MGKERSAVSIAQSKVRRASLFGLCKSFSSTTGQPSKAYTDYFDISITGYRFQAILLPHSTSNARESSTTLGRFGFDYAFTVIRSISGLKKWNRRRWCRMSNRIAPLAGAPRVQDLPKTIRCSTGITAQATKQRVGRIVTGVVRTVAYDTHRCKSPMAATTSMSPSKLKFLAYGLGTSTGHSSFF